MDLERDVEDDDLEEDFDLERDDDLKKIMILKTKRRWS